MKRFLLVFLLSIFLIPSVYATQFTYSFSGIMTDVEAMPELSWVGVGTQFSGMLEYDFPDDTTLPLSREDLSSLSFSFEIGGLLQFDAPLGSVDHYSLRDNYLEFWTEGGASGSYASYEYISYDIWLELHFLDSALGTWSPNSPLPYELLDYGTIWLSGANVSEPMEMWGRFETMNPAPEPTTVVLFSFGLLGLSGFLRKLNRSKIIPGRK